VLGIVTHIRLVQINNEEVRTMLAMNRLRHAYLKIAPGVRPYFGTGFHDDERGLAASYLLSGSQGLRPWSQFLQAMATLVATVDAVLAASTVVMAMQAADASGRHDRGRCGRVHGRVGRAGVRTAPCIGSVAAHRTTIPQPDRGRVTIWTVVNPSMLRAWLCRRCAATSWRSTRISTSLAVSVRASSASQPSTRPSSR
jgi:hypothetical protein